MGTSTSSTTQLYCEHKSRPVCIEPILQKWEVASSYIFHYKIQRRKRTTEIHHNFCGGCYTNGYAVSSQRRQVHSSLKDMSKCFCSSDHFFVGDHQVKLLALCRLQLCSQYFRQYFSLMKCLPPNYKEGCLGQSCRPVYSTNIYMCSQCIDWYCSLSLLYRLLYNKLWQRDAQQACPNYA